MPDQLHWTYGVSVACGRVWSRANQPRKPDLMTPAPEETVGKTTAYHLLNQSTIGTKFTPSLGRIISSEIPGTI